MLREALGSRIELLAVVDCRALPSPFAGVPVLVGEDGLQRWLAARSGVEGLHAAVAIGGARGRDRLARMDQLASLGFSLLGAIHARAFLAADAHCGEACQVLAMAAVCSHVSLGRGVIVNTAASVDHDCEIADGAHIGPGAVLAGEVRIGECAFVGAGAIVLPGRQIGADAVVGAGAVVTRDVAPRSVVIGSPARLHSQA
ncbi:NeuD/PglB/VioB family sugar acetyltransferase [Tahibacter aquaticus]|uniref:NeuD/PglB/VioB family sugar acetyltransferase n=1 Tax=Tahibacter aquaticus TaxID=520092 RepID=UPI001FB6FDB7|nr:NeuD/PglB/VioB family sugar acetyltransferase [Tahibacter aquaticus]